MHFQNNHSIVQDVILVGFSMDSVFITFPIFYKFYLGIDSVLYKITINMH
jgi:hypothetical protein